VTLRITCPHCGSRSIDEWVHGEIPTVPDSITDPDQRDLDRGFHHDNHHGEVREAWFHAAGCRRWVIVVRDTDTDRFGPPADDQEPEKRQTNPNG
jgi:sarcosine oxidase subunit delta